MRSILLLLIIILVTSCDKPVSKEQREAVREELKRRTPLRISDEQILSKAFEEARMDLLDSAVTQYQWKSFFVKPADSLLSEIWLAYEYAVEGGVTPKDNVQILDSIVVYSKPIITNDSLQRMHIAFLPKKSIILKLTDQ